ncbi:hypothetical protein DYQ86_01285 [Acidobacteria bacterium AB60]|nr:hypothetical protein DYQ86_01285 [Acidobacteria bacterium AB60]
MKLSVPAIALSLLTLPGLAQPTISNPWVGLWQDQQPGVLLTLGDDNGQLAGGIVFNIVAHNGGQTYLAGRDAHAILTPRVDGDTLSFQVIRRPDSRKLDITVRMTADGKATLHCRNCGPDAPTVEIIRER